MVGLLCGAVLFSSRGAFGGEEPGWEEEIGREEQSSEYLERISLHGYGELHYNNPETGSTVPGNDDPAQMDFHRLVIGLSYPFSDRIVFHAEVDFEHAAQELELEMAYLDFLLMREFNIRAGSLLMPVGPLNEFHEPPFFYSVERPYVQTYIIPTTWQEGGLGIFGAFGGGNRYRVYAVSGLDASGFSPSGGIRGGRGKVAKQPSEDLAVVGRLEMVGIPGFDTGFSVYWGGAGQGIEELDEASVGIVEGDIRLRRNGFDIRAVVAWVGIGGADRIGEVIGDTVGSVLLGWYLEGAYDFLRLHPIPVDQKLVAFVRLEAFDTHRETPDGRPADPSNDRTVVTGGISFYPHPDVALKADVERWEDGADDAGTRFNLATTFQY
jgi:hypothetical protein